MSKDRIIIEEVDNGYVVTEFRNKSGIAKGEYVYRTWGEVTEHIAAFPHTRSQEAEK